MELIIPELLVVCGPSGSGKSTLIAQLSSDSLQPTVRSQLPRLSSSWPEVPAQKFVRFLENRDTADRSNVTLHYDLNKAVRNGINNYADEPAAQRILCATTITIVKIKPSPERLWSQFAHRCFGGATFEETKNIVLSGANLTSAAKLLELYSQPAWLETRWRLWDDFLQIIAGQRRIERQIVVEPIGDIYKEGEYSWRLVDIKGASSASSSLHWRTRLARYWSRRTGRASA